MQLRLKGVEDGQVQQAAIVHQIAEAVEVEFGLTKLGAIVHQAAKAIEAEVSLVKLP